MKQYVEYEVEDFVMDESFRNWVFSENMQDELFWKTWIQQHPGMKPIIHEAVFFTIALKPAN